ncbi:unnamed protein product [Calicophoron daubneyi]|uniref:Gelsolin-like domain-containing protein n=1 Tax=Calicophoron daubneyi TaxID=300641 RepID=A0AAV2T6Z7_CALDB
MSVPEETKNEGEIRWQDTNLALIGSDLDKEVRKDSALTESAWRPVLNIKEPKLLVWRIEQFKVRPVNEQDYGQFFNGDSYIVLNIHKKDDKLLYDIHFWIGQNSSQDEYGTAAYKTVELDALLDDQAVQHREVEHFESKLFKSYFPRMKVIGGGVESGFRKVKTSAFQPRLLRFCRKDKKEVSMSEVSVQPDSLDSNDVFILDLGDKAYQWNGKKSNKEERFDAAKYLRQLASERCGRCKTEVLDEEVEADHEEFLCALPTDDIEVQTNRKVEAIKNLYRLSDESGELKFELIASNRAPKSILTENDAYVIDTGANVFVYLGSQCSKLVKQNSLRYADMYLKETTHRLIPITVVRAGQICEDLDKEWDPED